jgi:hypothetical protein
MAVLTELADRFSPKRAGRLAIVGATLIDGTGAVPVSASTSHRLPSKRWPWSEKGKGKGKGDIARKGGIAIY